MHFTANMMISVKRRQIAKDVMVELDLRKLTAPGIETTLFESVTAKPTNVERVDSAPSLMANVDLPAHHQLQLVDTV